MNLHIVKPDAAIQGIEEIDDEGFGTDKFLDGYFKADTVEIDLDDLYIKGILCHSELVYLEQFIKSKLGEKK